jgi:hypothetical protein
MARMSRQSSDLLHIDFKQPNEMQFNRARMRRAFVRIGQRHMRDARRLVARRKVSKADENPGLQKGKLARSIGYYVPRSSKTRPGMMVKIAPNQKRAVGNRPITGAFYPAFLLYGVRRGARRRKSHHRGASGGKGWRIAPRSNYMTKTLHNNRPWTRVTLLRELRLSLKPVKRKGR